MHNVTPVILKSEKSVCILSLNGEVSASSVKFVSVKIISSLEVIYGFLSISLRPRHQKLKIHKNGWSLALS